MEADNQSNIEQQYQLYIDQPVASLWQVPRGSGFDPDKYNLHNHLCKVIETIALLRTDDMEERIDLHDRLYGAPVGLFELASDRYMSYCQGRIQEHRGEDNSILMNKLIKDKAALITTEKREALANILQSLQRS